MKKYLYIIVFAFITIVIGHIRYQQSELNKYKELYAKELQNIEAYQASNSGLNNEIRQYQMTMDDIRTSKDSLDRKLTKAIDDLKVKDKRIEYLQYQATAAHKTDTIVVPDTIFVPKVNIDTCLQDDWYKLKLGLYYPSKIVVSPTFNSEKYIIINSKKEYNKTPSKIFFIRWFQKKYTIIEVNVEEKSPYIINKEQKFIKILR